MSYYESEILNDLEIGEIYTSRDIASIVYYKRNSIILCEDTSNFRSEDTETKFKVIDRMETFIHKNERSSYVMNNTKQLIYVVKKI
ncbi:hypothetical protein [Bacillus sp. ISL-7]|uniref:hypothetical protein n=1 Tax=Bacillus sp. ISL-7 TaxID=2819136 RepID=UPI001BE60F97|nr:hypothetical protein [Bacillus sp. ISL-7]MBT2735150.1 hypothetical protein [Bacillus sp. ISL-7]